MSTDLRHRLGHAGEHFAAEHFERLGFRVLARRHRTRYGELDLVVVDERTLVFAEVKTRRAGSGRPWEALTPEKRQQVRRMAAAWLVDASARPYREHVRFDAVGVTVDAHDRLVALEHLEGAF